MDSFVTLKILDKFERLFERMGVNYPMMRRIIQVKLTMDQRRTPTVFAGNAKSGKPPAYELKNGRITSTDGGSVTRSFLKAMGFYLLIGGIGIAPFLLIRINYMMQLTLIFAIVLFMLTTTLISDFSSVLLDLKDKQILHTKPVDSRTLNMAKWMHIASYMTSLTLALTAIPLAVSLIKNGPVFFALFLLGIVLAVILVMGLTSLLYLLILKLFDGERLKDIINYVQIGLSVVVLAGYQLVMRVFDIVHFAADFDAQWWHLLLPPLWFAAPFEWILGGNSKGLILLMSLMSVLFPLLSAGLYIRFGGSFERYLQKMQEGNAKPVRNPRRFRNPLPQLLCRTPAERSFYSFGVRMMSRERDFKLKTYPILGFALIFPFVFLLNAVSSSDWDTVRGSRGYLVIYLSTICIPTVIQMLRYSGNYKASYIYRTTPLKDMNAVYKGTLKAALLRLFVPLLVLQGILFVCLFGVRIIPDVISLLLTASLYSVISFRVYGRELPFSESFANKGQDDLFKFLIVALCLGAFAAVHYISLNLPFGAYGYAVLLACANAAVWSGNFEPGPGK